MVMMFSCKNEDMFCSGDAWPGLKSKWCNSPHKLSGKVTHLVTPHLEISSTSHDPFARLHKDLRLDNATATQSS